MQLETITGPEFLPDWNRCLLLGYADIPAATIGKAVQRLARVFG